MTSRNTGAGEGADGAVQLVAFDLMDTVLSDPFREALEAATGWPLEELLAHRDRSVYPAFERGELTEDAYWQHYRAVGIEVDPAAFHRVRRAGIGFLPGMAELLDELASHLRLVTASNYPLWIDELAVGILAGRFEQVLGSHHLAARKPDVEFYDRLLARVGLPAGRVLFVDDRDVNVAGARAAGIAAHRFTDVARLRRWLADHGVPVTS